MTEVHIVEAETIDKVEGMMPTENGRHIIAQVIINGETRHLAIPLEAAIPTAINLFAFDRLCRQIAADQDRDEAPMLLKVKDWDVILTDAGAPILNIQTRGKIDVAYQFSPDDLPELIAGLTRVADFLRQAPLGGVTKQ